MKELNSVSQLAWIAGILDGEGCFFVRAQRQAKTPYFYPAISVEMSDKDIIDYIASKWGSQVLLRKPRSNGNLKKVPANPRQMYCTTVTGCRAVGWMMTLYSFMGERRKKKILELLTQYKSSPSHSLQVPV